MALTKISTSTWGATLKRARRVYTAVIRPAMTYGSTVWHTPKEVKKSAVSNKLAVIQNKCLRAVTGAFRATPVAVLEAESHIPPITNHLDHLQINARHRLTATGAATLVKKTCQKIAGRLRGTRGRARTAAATLGARKQVWVDQLQVDPIKRIPPIPPPWMDITEEQAAAQLEARCMKKKRSDLTKRHFFKLWRIAWKHYQDSLQRTPTAAQLGAIDKNRLKYMRR